MTAPVSVWSDDGEDDEYAVERCRRLLEGDACRHVHADDLAEIVAEAYAEEVYHGNDYPLEQMIFVRLDDGAVIRFGVETVYDVSFSATAMSSESAPKQAEEKAS
jgi:hypothetical protein